MKIISWNVAGINACVKKGLIGFMKSQKADVYCFQEIRTSKDKIPKELTALNEYFQFNLFGSKNGYSGVSVYTKLKPIRIVDALKYDLGGEGRILVLEFDKLFLINAYFPHAHRKLTRLDFKLKFNESFLSLCDELKKVKPIVVAADFNVAHKEIDLRNPKQNMKNAGFTESERKWFDEFLKIGYIDSFREFNKEGGNYTWWTYRNDARKRNIGWRIDYFVVSDELKDKVKKSEILKEVHGSDHCPISIDIDA